MRFHDDGFLPGITGGNDAWDQGLEFRRDVGPVKQRVSGRDHYVRWGQGSLEYGLLIK